MRLQLNQKAYAARPPNFITFPSEERQLGGDFTIRWDPLHIGKIDPPSSRTDQSFDIAGPAKTGLAVLMHVRGGGSTGFAGAIQQMESTEWKTWTELAGHLYEGEVTDVVVDDH